MLRKGLFLLLALVLAGVVGFAEGASFFDDPEINALIDANYAEVQEKGWAELVIPESLHHFGRDRISPNALTVGQKLIDRGFAAYIVGGTVRIADPEHRLGLDKGPDPFADQLSGIVLFLFRKDSYLQQIMIFVILQRHPAGLLASRIDAPQTAFPISQWH